MNIVLKPEFSSNLLLQNQSSYSYRTAQTTYFTFYLLISSHKA